MSRYNFRKTVKRRKKDNKYVWVKTKRKIDIGGEWITNVLPIDVIIYNIFPFLIWKSSLEVLNLRNLFGYFKNDSERIVYFLYRNFDLTCIPLEKNIRDIKKTLKILSQFGNNKINHLKIFSLNEKTSTLFLKFKEIKELEIQNNEYFNMEVLKNLTEKKNIKLLTFYSLNDNDIKVMCNLTFHVYHKLPNINIINRLCCFKEKWLYLIAKNKDNFFKLPSYENKTGEELFTQTFRFDDDEESSFIVIERKDSTDTKTRFKPIFNFKIRK
jgi:hypothetical protein